MLLASPILLFMSSSSSLCLVMHVPRYTNSCAIPFMSLSSLHFEYVCHTWIVYVCVYIYIYIFTLKDKPASLTALFSSL